MVPNIGVKKVWAVVAVACVLYSRHASAQTPPSVYVDTIEEGKGKKVSQSTAWTMESELNAEIQRLLYERSKYPLTIPAVMVAAGIGVPAMGTFGYMLAEPCARECSSPWSTILPIYAVGLGTATWGGVLLYQRLGVRREIGERLGKLRQLKHDMGYEVRLSPSVDSLAFGLQLNGHF